MYNIGVVGIGFLGGSLVKEFSKSKKVKEIIAFDKNIESLKMAYNDGVITNYSTQIDEKFNCCDVIFICTPVSYIFETVISLKKYIKKDCIITDIGSTKKTIVEKAKKVDINFIGGHPMVGSERSGYSTSKEMLFENSYYIIAKNDDVSEKSLDILKELILELKAIPVIIDSNEHDYIVAAISHIPHIVAASLVNLVKNLDDENETMKMLAAGGFKDITRIASSDPTMWENICKENKSEIIKVLDSFCKIIETIKGYIENEKKEDIYNFFESSKKYRDSFINRRVSGDIMPELNISIKDENGAIAKITSILSENNISIKNIEVLNNRENNFGALRVVVRTYDERDKGYNIIKEKGYEITKVN